MTINVTIEDLQRSVELRSLKMRYTKACPLAVALQRILGDSRDVIVTGLHFFVDGKSYDLPKEVKAIVAKFDTTGQMASFSFESNLIV